MSATNFTPIQLYRTSTAAAVPTAGNLADGELAINLTDEALYFKNAAGVVKLLADSSGALGSVTSVDVSGGTTGLTTSGGPITSSGTITLAGTLGVANGGTGTATAFTAGSVVFAGASGVYTQDNANLFWDNANDRLGIGTASPGSPLDVQTNSSALGISLRGRSSDNISSLAVRSNDGATIYGQVQGRSTDFRLEASSSNILTVYTNATERMRIDAAGVVGIGVTPATWSSFKALQFGDVGAIYSNNFGSGNTQTIFSNNAYFNSGYKYLQSSSAAAQYTQIGGTHAWSIAPTGTAGGAITFTQAMTLDSSGRVGIGTTSPTFPLCVSANGGTDEAFVSGVVGGAYFGAVGAKPIVFQNDSTEKMRIDASGNVGIGNSAPGATLALQAANNFPFINWNNSSNTQIAFAGWHGGSGGGGDFRIGTVSTTAFAFQTNNAERMRITDAGDVGIGISTPGAKLHVATPASGAGVIFRYASGTNNPGLFISTIEATSVCEINATGSTGNNNLAIAISGTERIRVNSDGKLLLGTTSLSTYTANINGTLGVYGGNGLFLQNGSNNAAAAIYNDGASSVSQIQFNAGGGEKMRIDSAGELLVGTTLSTAGRKLDVRGGNVFFLGTHAYGSYNENSNSAIWNIRGNQYCNSCVSFTEAAVADRWAVGIRAGETALIFAADTNDIHAGTERMRLTGSGNLLVGTTSNPESSRAVFSGSSQATMTCITDTTSTSNQIIFRNPNGAVGAIFTSGTATTYSTSSDYRLKDIDGPVANSGAYIDALKPVQGSWKADGSRFIGLLAHEVQEVSETPIATGEKDGEKMQAMDYSAPELIANLIAEIQSLRARVAQLEGN